MSDSLIEQKLQAASSFILQSPPGEVNDIFHDVRTIVGDDAALESGILPALEQYNVEQFVEVELEKGHPKVIVCSAGQVSGQKGRFVDPRSKRTFAFDHMGLKASNIQPLEVDEDVETIRVAIQTAADTYTTEHYPLGFSNVFSPRRVENNSSSAAPAAAQEDSDTPMEGEGEAVAPATEPVAESGEPVPKRFEIFIVANRYNPSNFWTGRWRSTYAIDLDKTVIEGKILLSCHYYEQGNVQLNTNKTVSLPLPNPLPDSPASIANAAFKLISATERAFQTDLHEAYSDLSERTFKELRRGLPRTKSKIDWNRLGSYQLGGKLAGSSS